MKKLYLLSLLPLMLCGCMNAGRLATALGKDPASVHVRITTIYGTVEVTRTNPNTNTAPHTIGTDGSIKVEKK